MKSVRLVDTITFLKKHKILSTVAAIVGFLSSVIGIYQIFSEKNTYPQYTYTDFRTENEFSYTESDPEGGVLLEDFDFHNFLFAHASNNSVVFIGITAAFVPLENQVILSFERMMELEPKMFQFLGRDSFHFSELGFDFTHDNLIYRNGFNRLMPCVDTPYVQLTGFFSFDYLGCWQGLCHYSVIPVSPDPSKAEHTYKQVKEYLSSCGN